MKLFNISVSADYDPQFSWFVIPTVEIGVFDRYISFYWLCISITIRSLE